MFSNTAERYVHVFVQVQRHLQSVKAAYVVDLRRDPRSDVRRNPRERRSFLEKSHSVPDYVRLWTKIDKRLPTCSIH